MMENYLNNFTTNEGLSDNQIHSIKKTRMEKFGLELQKSKVYMTKEKFTTYSTNSNDPRYEME